MGVDPYQGCDTARSDNCIHGAAVALDVEFDFWSNILVCATGNIEIVTAGGEDLTVPINSVPYVLPWLVKQVKSSGTTIASPTTNIFRAYSRPRG